MDQHADEFGASTTTIPHHEHTVAIPPEPTSNHGGKIDFACEQENQQQAQEEKSMNDGIKSSNDDEGDESLFAIVRGSKVGLSSHKPEFAENRLPLTLITSRLSSRSVSQFFVQVQVETTDGSDQVLEAQSLPFVVVSKLLRTHLHSGEHQSSMSIARSHSTRQQVQQRELQQYDHEQEHRLDSSDDNASFASKSKCKAHRKRTQASAGARSQKCARKASQRQHELLDGALFADSELTLEGDDALEADKDWVAGNRSNRCFRSNRKRVCRPTTPSASDATLAGGSEMEKTSDQTLFNLKPQSAHVESVNADAQGYANQKNMLFQHQPHAPVPISAAVADEEAVTAANTATLRTEIGCSEVQMEPEAFPSDVGPVLWQDGTQRLEHQDSAKSTLCYLSEEEAGIHGSFGTCDASWIQPTGAADDHMQKHYDRLWPPTIDGQSEGLQTLPIVTDEAQMFTVGNFLVPTM